MTQMLFVTHVTKAGFTILGTPPYSHTIDTVFGIFEPICWKMQNCENYSWDNSFTQINVPGMWKALVKTNKDDP